MRTLWLTNDLPPRAGGIEQFLGNLLRRTDPDQALVVGPRRDGAEGYDAEQPYDVVRAPGAVLPTPSILRLVRAQARRHRPDVLVLGATWPLGELGPALARDPGVPIVGVTHGLEAGLTQVGLGVLVRRAVQGLTAITTISDFTARRLQRVARDVRVERIPPGVDTEAFSPAVDGTAMRQRWRVPAGAPLVLAVSRLVRRKGQDVLLEAWSSIVREHPDAHLVVAGTGPMEDDLRRRAHDIASAHVVGEVPWEDLPATYGAADLLAVPCRTRWMGLDVEGLGIVYLEAQAAAVPVVVGRSGGAPETIREGTTGVSVDGRDPTAVAAVVASLLADADRRARMGVAGRQWVEERWSWDTIAGRFRRLLADVTR